MFYDGAWELVAMFDPKAIAAQLDGRVLAVLISTESLASVDRLAALAGTNVDGLRVSMRRLALRVPGRTWPWALVSEYDVAPYWWPAARLAMVV